MAEVDLKGRAVIITGGGSGLGKAMCMALADAGAEVFAAEVNDQHAEELLAQAREEGVADHVEYVKTDVTDYRSCEALAAHVIDKCGAIYGLINCAGRNVPLSELPGRCA